VLLYCAGGCQRARMLMLFCWNLYRRWRSSSANGRVTWQQVRRVASHAGRKQIGAALGNAGMRGVWKAQFRSQKQRLSMNQSINQLTSSTVNHLLKQKMVQKVFLVWKTRRNCWLKQFGPRYCSAEKVLPSAKLCKVVRTHPKYVSFVRC